MVIPEPADDLWYAGEVRLGPPLDELVAFEAEVLVVMMRLNGGLELYVVPWCLMVFLQISDKHANLVVRFTHSDS